MKLIQATSHLKLGNAHCCVSGKNAPPREDPGPKANGYLTPGGKGEGDRAWTGGGTGARGPQSNMAGPDEA